MKVVIDIDYDTYRKIIDSTNRGKLLHIAATAIQKGKILPKGHGDLIDRQELINGLEFVIENGATNFRGKHDITAEGYLDILKRRPIIIEADKETDSADSD